MDIADRAQQVIDADVQRLLDDQRALTQGSCDLSECEECGEPIPPARRKAVPNTRLCVGCADLNERRR